MLWQTSAIVTSVLVVATAASPMSPASPILPRAGGGFNPNCPKQQPGLCVFLMSYTQSPASDGEYQCGLYDYTCTGITDFVTCNPAGVGGGYTVLNGNGLNKPVGVEARGSVGDAMYATISEGSLDEEYNQDSPGVTRRDCNSAGIDVCSELYIPFPCS